MLAATVETMTPMTMILLRLVCVFLTYNSLEIDRTLCISIIFISRWCVVFYSDYLTMINYKRQIKQPVPIEPTFCFYSQQLPFYSQIGREQDELVVQPLHNWVPLFGYFLLVALNFCNCILNTGKTAVAGKMSIQFP